MPKTNAEHQKAHRDRERYYRQYAEDWMAAVVAMFKEVGIKDYPPPPKRGAPAPRITGSAELERARKQIKYLYRQNAALKRIKYQPPGDKSTVEKSARDMLRYTALALEDEVGPFTDGDAECLRLLRRELKFTETVAASAAKLIEDDPKAALAMLTKAADE